MQQNKLIFQTKITVHTALYMAVHKILAQEPFGSGSYLK